MKWVDESPPVHWPPWPAGRPLPGSARPLLLIDRGVHARVLNQLRASAVEDGGLLLGVPWSVDHDSAVPAFIELLRAVPAPASDGTRMSLRMDHQVWSSAGADLVMLQRRIPAARVVGWYHSHPGFGAFFSGTDRRTQAAFFREPFSVGWCIDPSDDSHACFIGAASEPLAFEFTGERMN